MSKFLWIIAATLLVALPASAEIFKCVTKDGTALYQNFPCPIDSLGSMPSSLQSAKPTSMPTDTSPAPKAALANVASTAKSANAGEPRAGMTPDEVRALWGEPEEMIQDEPREGRIEIWRYADGRSVQFNNKHRVSAVQQ